MNERADGRTHGHGNFSARMVARFNRLCRAGRILSPANRIEAASDGR
jgi:hypothetical protein